jgi:hypothetical protein
MVVGLIFSQNPSLVGSLGLDSRIQSEEESTITLASAKMRGTGAVEKIVRVKLLTVSAVGNESNSARVAGACHPPGAVSAKYCTCTVGTE